MKILVTGATGFTGSHLTQALLRIGHRVRVLTRKPIDATVLHGLDLEMVQGEIQDPVAVDRAVEGCDLVYHLAANYRIAGVPDRVYREVHVDGTRNVVDACRKYGIQRLVHCSTVGVHGHIAHPPATEEAPYHPGDLYQATKVEGETVVLRAIKEKGLPAVIFRPGAIYGPGDLRFLKLYRAIARGRFVMLGSGETNYHFVYIDDLISGILLCGTHPEARGQVFILAGAEYITLNRIVEIIAETLNVPVPRWHFPVAPVYFAGYLCELLCKPFGVEPPLYRRRVEFFQNSRAFDISKAKKRLGYEPKVDLTAGIRQTAAWYLEQGYLNR